MEKTLSGLENLYRNSYPQDFFCPRVLFVKHPFPIKMHISILLINLSTIYLHFQSFLKALDRHFSSLFPPEIRMKFCGRT